MLTLNFWKNIGACLLFCAAGAISSSAQTLTTLATFDNTNGAYPYGTLVQGLDGNFYGTASGGARELCFGGCGTVFKISPGGTFTTVHEFIGTDGSGPRATLALAANGSLYGTFFEISAGDTFTLLARAAPSSVGLVQDTIDGKFYGTTGSIYSLGSVFAMTAGGTITTLHTFCSANPSCIKGGYAPDAPLIQGTDGFLYGTTYYGGATSLTQCRYSGCGTVFAIGTGGSLTTLHEFSRTDGVNPQAGLVEGSDGNFYGTTLSGGTGTGCCGTVYKVTPGGTLTTLHTFNLDADLTDGAYPYGGLVQATDGNFYGTTIGGGSYACGDGGCGTVFQITPGGTLTTVHIFDFTDGAHPYAGLVQGTDGNFYGTTNGDLGRGAFGTIFQLSLGLPPFVKTVPAAAYPGTQVFILGNNLTGTTAVTFGGKAAKFTVVSATEIVAIVPKDPCMVTVQVVTPSGTLSSNVPFRVF